MKFATLSLLVSILATLLGSATFAQASTWPAEMPATCESFLKTIVTDESSRSADQAAILLDLQNDWKKNPQNAKATYSDCGSSDFYYIVVDKATCHVDEQESGDSDGECN